MTSTELVGSTIAEQSLYRHLVVHVDEERDLLDAYQHAADESHSAAFQYLVSLIVEEERRHHAIFGELAKTLRTEVDRRPEAFAIPRLGHWGFERTHILEVTESFLDQERKDAAQLDDLEAELEPVKDSTMWQLLVRLMQADTRKHIEILEFVQEHVGRTWDSNDADWAGISKSVEAGDDR